MRSIILAAVVLTLGIANVNAQVGMSMADCQRVYGGDVKENTSVGWESITFYKDSCFMDMFFWEQKCVGVVYRPEFPISEQSMRPILEANGIRAVATKVAGASSVYVVQKGDALSKIAERFGVSTRALASANSLDPKKKLLYGKKLIIPGASSTVLECKGGNACFIKGKNMLVILSPEGAKYVRSYETAQSDFRRALGLAAGEPISCPALRAR